MITVYFIRTNNEKVCVEVPEGSTLMQAAREADLREIPADCGGNCACSTCKIAVISGSENLSEQEEEEREVLESYGWNPDEYRLACQCFVEEDGDVVLSLPDPE